MNVKLKKEPAGKTDEKAIIKFLIDNHEPIKFLQKYERK